MSTSPSISPLQFATKEEEESTPRRLLIFDINHVLMKKGTLHVRPFVQDFFAELDGDDHYTVAIWTATQMEKTEKSIDILFTPHQHNNLLFVWTHDSCTKLLDFQTTRSLAKVWTTFPQYGPDNTTVFVNDRKKVEDEYESCVWPIPSFEGPRKGKNDQIFATLKSELDRMSIE